MSCQKLKQLDFTYLFSGKESTYNEKDLDSIPGLGRCLGEGKGYSLQCSGLENSMGCIVHGSQRIRHNCVTYVISYIHSVYVYWKQNLDTVVQVATGIQYFQALSVDRKGKYYVCIFTHTHKHSMYIDMSLHKTWVHMMSPTLCSYYMDGSNLFPFMVSNFSRPQ